jgi:hypothetical protein
MASSKPTHPIKGQSSSQPSAQNKKRTSPPHTPKEKKGLQSKIESISKAKTTAKATADSLRE